MKKYLFILIAISMFAGFAAAQSTQKLMLKSGQEKAVINKKLSIKFVTVAEDSRCPAEAVCVWAGNAKVKLQVRKRNGKSSEVEVNTNLEPTTVKYLGYEIKIATLSPRTGEDLKTMIPKYTLVLEVTKI